MHGARRTAAALAAAVLVLVGAAAPAGATGTGGIELVPVQRSAKGAAASSFDVDVPSRGAVAVRYRLRNIADTPRSAHLFSAAVTQTDGNYSLGAPGSSPFVQLAEHDVTLQPGESREESFSVHPGPHGRPGGDQLAAVVLQVRNGAVVQRVNTLVRLHRGRLVPLPLLLVLVAAGLLLIGAAAVVVVVRSRRSAAPA